MSGMKPELPVVQILGSKRIAGAGDQLERFRLLISDGINVFSFAMLATQLNALHRNGHLAEYTVIRINRYTSSVLQRREKSVLIILELTVLKPGAYIGEKIGNPQLFELPAVSPSSSGTSAPLRPSIR